SWLAVNPSPCPSPARGTAVRGKFFGCKGTAAGLVPVEFSDLWEAELDTGTPIRVQLARFATSGRPRGGRRDPPWMAPRTAKTRRRCAAIFPGQPCPQGGRESRRRWQRVAGHVGVCFTVAVIAACVAGFV